MASMFSDAASLNMDISGWDVLSMKDMFAMFKYATSFNMNISGWNVLEENMGWMFQNVTCFNIISSWNRNVSSVTPMNAMFMGAGSFNIDISGWDVS